MGVLLLVALLATQTAPRTISVICERGQDNPFCGRYSERSDGYYLDGDSAADGWQFKIVEESGEYCLYLKTGLKMCGADHTDEVDRVSAAGVRSPLEGYAMEFHLWCNPDDIYCTDDDSPETKPNREISGGVDAARNYLPFMVRLRMKGDMGIPVTCGGALIHPRFVITAYHCFDTEGTINFDRHCMRSGRPNRRCFALVGDHFTDKEDPNEQRINMLKVHRFPGDLAVLELVAPAVIDNHTSQVVTVSSDQLAAGDLVRTAGWGQ